MSNVIDQVDEVFSQDEVTEHFRILQSQVSRWIAKRQEFMRDAAQKHWKLLGILLKKQEVKKVELYKVLWGKFKEARAQGHCVNVHWL